MRILWLSNAPHCNSGYGVCADNICTRLAQHHDVAIFAFWGLKGGMVNWKGVLVYPNDPEDVGNTLAQLYYEDFQADLIISQMDVWVLDQAQFGMMNWVPYVPIDTSTLPPDIKSHLQTQVHALAMSRHGERLLRENGLSCDYIPHGVDTNLYQPDEAVRQQVRATLNLEGKFVVGCVGANRDDRKNWEAMLEVFAIFHRQHPDSHLIAYTQPRQKGGILDMYAYCHELAIGEAVTFPTRILLARGATGAEMAQIYNAMDIFMLLSKGEGFGLPIIEAQATGVPVVVSDATSMTELCASGWLVKVGREEWSYHGARRAVVDWDDAVSKLNSAYACWQTNQWNARKEEARQFALRFDWDKVVKDYWLPVLEKLGKTYHRWRVPDIAFESDHEDQILQPASL